MPDVVETWRAPEGTLAAETNGEEYSNDYNEHYYRMY
jgi:hypothetical protein